MVTIKRPEEVARMRHAGTILADVLRVLEGELRPGVTTAELDAIAERMIRDAGATPSFLGYGGVARHDPVPRLDLRLAQRRGGPRHPVRRRRVERGRRGGARHRLHLAGMARRHRTHLRDRRRPRAPHAADRRDAPRDGGGDRRGGPGNRLGDVGAAIEAVAHEHGYGIVRPFVGHGIGTAMHEDPQVPNYGRPGTGMRIEAGMCFAIEPMFNLGGDDVALLDDGWTVVTADGSISAHFEDTIAVTPSGPEVLTRA